MVKEMSHMCFTVGPNVTPGRPQYPGTHRRVVATPMGKGHKRRYTLLSDNTALCPSLNVCSVAMGVIGPIRANDQAMVMCDQRL